MGAYSQTPAAPRELRALAAQSSPRLPLNQPLPKALAAAVQRAPSQQALGAPVPRKPQMLPAARHFEGDFLEDSAEVLNSTLAAIKLPPQNQANALPEKTAVRGLPLDLPRAGEAGRTEKSSRAPIPS